jgi:adenosylcobinamide-phosphate synthase
MINLPDSFPLLPILLAALIDYLIGDPWEWYHPVMGMGKAIEIGVNGSLRICQSPRSRKIAGILLGMTIVLGTMAFAAIIIAVCFWLHRWLGTIVGVVMLASSLAARSLRDAAEAVLAVLPATEGDLEPARQELSKYVGRDPQTLDREGILRAIFETVAENAVDGATAPLFWAIVGAFISPWAIVPFAWGYKAASTLDSTIGYRREPYTHLGWFSAKLEDILTWLPCRLTVVTVGLLSGKPLAVWRICWRDAIRDPSPNSGWSECVYAASLSVRVGGKNVYHGVVKEKPFLGNDDRPINPQIVRQAIYLTRYTILLWLIIYAIAAIVPYTQTPRSVESLKASLVDSRSCLQVSNDRQICQSKLC